MQHSFRLERWHYRIASKYIKGVPCSIRQADGKTFVASRGDVRVHGGTDMMAISMFRATIKSARWQPANQLIYIVSQLIDRI